MLLKHMLAFIDQNSKVRITGAGFDHIQRVSDAMEDIHLEGLTVRSVFASTFNSACITIELYDSKAILSESEIERKNKEFLENPVLTIGTLVNKFYFGAKEIILRTSSSYLFSGEVKAFMSYLECFKNRKIVKMKRLYIGQDDKNVIEIEVEEDIPLLKIRHILPYLYAHKQVTIMEWNQDWLYCGNADKIDGEILDRYIDKFFTSAQLPNRLVILLKHK